MQELLKTRSTDICFVREDLGIRSGLIRRKKIILLRSAPLARATILGPFVAVLFLFTPTQSRAQTLSITQDRTVRDKNGTGVIYQRALDALEKDPTNVWSGVPVAKRMNVGVFVNLEATGSAAVTNVVWTIPAPRIRDTNIKSDKCIGAGYLTECAPLDLTDLTVNPIQFLWKEPGNFTVNVSADVGGVGKTASLNFIVKRHPKAEIFYITGPGDPQTTDPGETRDNLLSEHSWWHHGVEGKLGTPDGEFFRFHRGFIQKFSCWRAIFGYPAVKNYVSAKDYVPNSPEVSHTGSPGSGDGIVNAGRPIDRHKFIITLPLRFTINGDGSKKLEDYADEDALASDIGSYHGSGHLNICHSGDFRFIDTTPADPIFHRFHWNLTQVHKLWQFLKLDGGSIVVDATTPAGAQVFYPEPAVKFLPFSLDVVQNCFPASGSVFLIGTTIVNCTVKDVTLLDPASPNKSGTTKSVQFQVVVNPPTPTVPKVDILFVLDLSGSFIDDLPNFKTEVAGANGAIDMLKAAHSDIQFGLVSFEDYPISPFGLVGMGDQAYRLDLDLTSNANTVKTKINGLQITNGGAGGDLPQSQLEALFQAATGTGRSIAGAHASASIASGQKVSFRPGAAKIMFLWTDASFHIKGDPGDIPYPGPTLMETADAIMNLDPPIVIGLATEPKAIPDLEALAIATGSLAPAGGVDCDADGIIDIVEGDPLVCSSPGGASEGIGDLIESGVSAGLESPLADAGPFQVLDCNAPPGEATVTLFGGGSSDPLGDPLTFSWSGSFGEATGVAPTVTLSEGQHNISLTVTDPDGNTATDTVLIVISGDFCAAKIPTVSVWGMIALTLLLLTGGKIYFGRRRVAH